MDFSTLLKTQDQVVKLIDNSFRKNRLVNIYLFEGIKGTCKMEAAYYLASLILCENEKEKKPCGECLSCRRIKNGNHPRVFLIEPKKDSILKEQIDDLEHEFSMISMEKGDRVFIINGIEKATASAANSLLKFLEEAKAGNYGILISENVDRVLKTIKSRSQIVSFSLVPRENLVNTYLQKGINQETANILSTITNDIDEGMKYIEEGIVLDIIDFIKKLVFSMENIESKNPLLVLTENGRFLLDDNNKVYHNMFLDLLVTITNDKIYKILNQEDLVIFSETIEKIYPNMNKDYKKTVEQVEKILEYKKRLAYNINMELMYIEMLVDIMR